MKNRIGLPGSDIGTIIRILSQYSSVERAHIFGSRAKDNFKNGSDVDIALKGSELDFDTVIHIS